MEEKSESARQRTLERELEAGVASPRARQAKSKARLAADEQLLSEENQKRKDTIEIRARQERAVSHKNVTNC